jgi:hypothetical protein
VINWQGTVISQYNQSPTMQTLLYAINQWLDPTKNLDDFYNFIWNVDTAKGYGLDVWGRIVAIDRVLNVQPQAPFWGFTEATNVSAWPFNQGIFYNHETTLVQMELSDEGFRTLIMAKAAFNIINGSIPAINQLLLTLFKGRGNCYVVDCPPDSAGHPVSMSMLYVFDFIPTNVEAAIIVASGVLPRPTGVSVAFSFKPAPQAVIGGSGRVRATAT